MEKSTKQRLACKVLSKVMIHTNDHKHLVRNEVRIHRQLKHHHIVSFIEAFEDNNYVYMIQSLCSNRTLHELRKQRNKIELQECRYFIHQILQGTKYMHDQNIIHRDLKPTNILIDTNMQMKICDFGLAIHIDDPRLHTESLCGTTNYLAPEVINRNGFKRRSDIWAIGVITFILLYGYKPFEEADIFSTHDRILRAKYR